MSYYFKFVLKKLSNLSNGIFSKLSYRSTWLAPVTKELPLKGDTVVGNDVWIGQNVTILPGVHIGDGAIIGLNSVVTKDVPPYTIVAGNPAKIVRKRFDDELIDLLLKLKWWNKSAEEINALIPLLSCSDLTKVKQEIKSLLA